MTDFENLAQRRLTELAKKRVAERTNPTEFWALNNATTHAKAQRDARRYAFRQWLKGSTVRYMYDDYDGLTIPSDAKMVARYSWWTTAEVNLWIARGANPIVLIATRASDNFGDVLDCESGDATPPETGGWITLRKKAGYFRPTIYCDRAAVASVRVGTGQYKLGVDYDLWVADWTGKAHSIAGAAAVQYLTVPHQYDLSLVSDPGWPHRTGVPVPVPPPAPVPPAYLPVRLNDTGPAVVLLQKDLNRYIAGEAGEHPLVVDGLFGIKTLDAVLNFQRAKHLTVDGVVGPQTWTSLAAVKEDNL